MAGIFEQWCPETKANFDAMCKHAFREGALTTKEKELITLAIGICVRCGACIETHAQKCIDAGCTMEEIAEMVEICAVMQGGPGTAFGSMALQQAELAMKNRMDNEK